jgi:IclR family acetate operon transcriptional repressor
MIKPRKVRKAAPVGTLTKTLRLLNFVCEAQRGVALQEVSERTGLNKSTSYRLMAHLEHERYLARDAANAYVMGIRIIELARRENWVEGLRAKAWPFLVELARETGETVNLAVLDTDSIRYLDVVESRHVLRLVSLPGMKRPLHSTALGKALMAFLPEEDREGLINVLNFRQLTPKTITSAALYRTELGKVRERGYAVDDEEAVAGARCVAAAIFDSQEQPLAAVSVAGPVSRVTQGRVGSLGQAARATASRISEKLWDRPF